MSSALLQSCFSHHRRCSLQPCPLPPEPVPCLQPVFVLTKSAKSYLNFTEPKPIANHAVIFVFTTAAARCHQSQSTPLPVPPR
ncbi:hypothetical protein M0R45_008770 [Rubus argutus]|uniref:Uncharacterized protein n=1 Tax=Rubus argutus TaxID=59490 RepID=A0AAW1Y292_RUBAR